MEILTRMDLALAYVEDNLTDEIDREVLARIACCSALPKECPTFQNRTAGSYVTRNKKICEKL